MSILDIAHRLGLHPNTVRFHLQALTESGRVERVESTRTVPGRPPLMFRAHRGMDPAGPRNYLLLAGALAAGAAPGRAPRGSAVESGQAWGRRLAADAVVPTPPSDEHATDRLVEILSEVGFAPERRSGPQQSEIGLRNCPFLELVEEHAQVVCPLHLGLMQGVLTSLGATVTVRDLEPFVESDVCMAHLGPVDD
jgi:predicted ArsR family transcriptional regulator